DTANKSAREAKADKIFSVKRKRIYDTTYHAKQRQFLAEFDDDSIAKAAAREYASKAAAELATKQSAKRAKGNAKLKTFCSYASAERTETGSYTNIKPLQFD